MACPSPFCPIRNMCDHQKKYSMKHFLTLLLPFLMALSVQTIVQASPVDETTARQNARQFVSKGAMRRAKGDMAIHTAFTIDRSVKGVTNRPMVYAFNIGDDGGFVIASGDDAAEPVLGYGEGHLDINDIPCNMRAFLEGYADEIAWAQEKGLGKPAGKVRQAGTKVSISNMVNCKWGQNEPYYNDCPKIGKNRCLTGCVATAMAQIMYYWGKIGRNGEKFQHGCTALKAYTTRSKGISVGAKNEISKFDWANMTATYNNKSSDKAKNAVKTLMRYCGQSVQMDYNTSGSGAFCTDIPFALKTYFGYDSHVSHVDHKDYSSLQWEDLIYSELAEGRPVIVNGSNVGDTSGHAFICTGYDSASGKFYINWGWSGQLDNFFSLQALVPDSESNYQYHTGAVIGIQPPTEDDDTWAEHETLAIHNMSFSYPRVLNRAQRAFNGDDEVKLSFVFYNNHKRYDIEDDDDEDYEYETDYYDYALAVLDENDNIIQIIKERDNDWFYLGGSGQQIAQFRFGEEMPYGIYNITMVCRRQGETQWKRMMHSENYRLQADVNETNITLKPVADITVNGITSTSNKKVWDNVLSLTNNGCGLPFGTYYITVNGKLVSGCYPEAAPGQTEEILLDYKSQIKATDIVEVFSDKFLENCIYSNKAESDYARVSWNLSYDNYMYGSELFDDTYKIRLRMTNTGGQTYHHDVKVSLLLSENDTEAVASQTQELTLAPHETRILHFDFPDMPSDVYHYVKLVFPSLDYYGDLETERVSSSSYRLGKGVVVEKPGGRNYYRDGQTVTPPSDALYVDARYSGQLSKLRAGGNANTLYLLPEGATIPDALQGRNVVVGDRASAVTLEHGHGFCSPIDFTADEISYTRTFDNGHNGKTKDGWNTIALPFDVESSEVSVDGKSTTWFKSNSDSGRKFWLYDFASDDDRTVTFGYTLRMEANKPYLIAVPDNAWGAKYDLRGKTFTFTGHDALIRGGEQKAVTDNGGRFDFIGRPCGATRSVIYALNEAGSKFAFEDTGIEIEPFTAYFVDYYGNDGANAVSFRFDDGLATPVREVRADKEQPAAIYTIDGVRVNDGASLPSGIYIVDGKKRIVK